MDVVKYFEAVVVFEHETDSGKVKKVKERYLVEAASVSAAETRVHEFLNGAVDAFSVESAKESKIINVLEQLI